MTPKEKAEELILKFMRLQEPNYNWFHSKLAKQCALIAVDEILSSRPVITDSQVEYNNFWNDVKSELQSL